MRVKFHPDARADLREAKAFSRHRSPLAAVVFAQHIEAQPRAAILAAAALTLAHFLGLTPYLSAFSFSV